MTTSHSATTPALASVLAKLGAQLTAYHLDLATLQAEGVNTSLIEQMFTAGYCVVLTRGLYSRCWQLQGLVANVIDAQLLARALRARHLAEDIYLLNPLEDLVPAS